MIIHSIKKITKKMDLIAYIFISTDILLDIQLFGFPLRYIFM